MGIAEVAKRSGVSASTLRYYEQLDLLPAPERATAGYRAYDESVLARLAFITRAKMLGCSLEEIAGLMPDWECCADVQDRLRALVTIKLGDAETRLGALVAFTRDLHRILAGLASDTPEGPCHSDCVCVTDDSPAPPTPGSAEPVVCTLEAADMPGRLQQWRHLVTHVVDRTAIDGGTRLQLDSATPLGQLALLVGAEQRCCSFFAFAITVDSRGIALEVTGPPEAQAMVESLFDGATS